MKVVEMQTQTFSSVGVQVVTVGMKTFSTVTYGSFSNGGKVVNVCGVTFFKMGFFKES
ncbi:MAG: hypothetical protein LUG27_02020 [Clostridiales bacterium]|nr:hypothetical protein [Clostridiales bacterium]